METPHAPLLYPSPNFRYTNTKYTMLYFDPYAYAGVYYYSNQNRPNVQRYRDKGTNKPSRLTYRHMHDKVSLNEARSSKLQSSNQSHSYRYSTDVCILLYAKKSKVHARQNGTERTSTSIESDLLTDLELRRRTARRRGRQQQPSRREEGCSRKPRRTKVGWRRES